MARRIYIFLATLFTCFCQNLIAMEATCKEIEDGIHHPVVINQTFAAYKKERGEQPLKLLFPGGRTVRSVEDPRGKQQEHEGFFTIDYDEKCFPQLQGSVFSEKLWEEVEDNSLDLIHIEIPGGLFLCGTYMVGREEKDRFILTKVNSKLKIGGKLFIDLRYSRFLPVPNIDVCLNFAEVVNHVKKILEEDTDSFVYPSYHIDYKHRASYWHSLLKDPQDEIYEIFEKKSNNLLTLDDLQKLEDLEKRVQEKLESMSEEEQFGIDAPYMIIFDKMTREKIFDQYNNYLKQFGFSKIQVIEIFGKKQQDLPLPDIQYFNGYGIYQDMCFLDNIAEYVKVEEIQ